MNASNAKDFLPLVQALAEGKVIQYKWSDDKWRDGEELSFECELECYRIKPEPREIWVNRYPDGSEFGRYACREEAVEMASIGAVQVCWREVIE